MMRTMITFAVGHNEGYSQWKLLIDVKPIKTWGEYSLVHKHPQGTLKWNCHMKSMYTFGNPQNIWLFLSNKMHLKLVVNLQLLFFAFIELPGNLGKKLNLLFHNLIGAFAFSYKSVSIWTELVVIAIVLIFINHLARLSDAKEEAW